MQSMEYRLFYDGRPLSTEHLRCVREITVEQEVDMAWEGRIKIPAVVDEHGRWTLDDELTEPFSRVRIEIKLGNGSPVPLIDGPAVGFDRPMHSQPGQSFLDLVVRDDSAYMNQHDKIANHVNKKDSGIAETIFQDYRNSIASTDIQETENEHPVTVQRCTDMQMLKMLARRNGMHAYVLPGDELGHSVGCFKPFDTEGDGLTPLILLGPEKNITLFNVTHDSTRASRVMGFDLDMNNRNISSYNSDFNGHVSMDMDNGMGDLGNMGLHILTPYQGLSDMEDTVVARAENSSYAFEARGQTVENCYADVLQPYKVVSVHGVNSRLSGDYLITRVSHKINRTFYSQSFNVWKQVDSSTPSGGQDNLQERII